MQSKALLKRLADTIPTETLLAEFLLQHRPQYRRLPQDVGKVLRCIHDNLFDPDLSVKRLKSRCQVRDNNISSRFRLEIGSTIKDYIDSLRIEAAGLLLREQGIGVFELSQLLGYYSHQTFYSAFQKRFNCTPGSYRQRFSERREN